VSTELRDLLGDLVQTNGRLVRVAARRLVGTEAAAESPAVWRTLGVLASRGPMRVSELAAHSRVAAPTMTKLVATLLERGHVLRTADPSDARASTISITDGGRAAYEAWRGAVAAALAPYFADLPAADLDALRRTVRLLQERIELGESETRTKHQDADLEVSKK
jgi:DNA-binding MarR family transcriptional regulator